MKSVLICVVTYKAAELTTDCLASLEPEMARLPGCRVVAVDNASGDGSVEAIRAAIRENGWDSFVTLVVAPANDGYAAGNNFAIRYDRERHGPTDYVVLLNPDTVVRPGAMRILVDFMEEHPDIGIAGSRSEDPDGTPQYCCFRFPSALSEFAANMRLGIVDHLLTNIITRLPIPDEAQPIGWVSGASMIIRRQVIDDIGLLDDRYFLYYEETDFILRAKRAGWPCWFVPQSRIVHLVGQSTGVTARDVAPPRRPAYWFESRRRYFVKNYGAFYAALVDFMAIAGCSTWRVRRAIQRKAHRDPPRFLRDLIRHSVFFKGVRV